MVSDWTNTTARRAPSCEARGARRDGVMDTMRQRKETNKNKIITKKSKQQ